MQATLLAAATGRDYRLPADTLSSPFLQGLLLAAPLPESDTYSHLDLLSKAACEAKGLSRRAALACQVMKTVSGLQGFATVFEETKCVMLVKRTLMALTSVDSMGNSLRELVLESVGKAVRCVLEIARAAGSFQELNVVLRDKCVLLGEKTLNRLSPVASRFLAGEKVPNYVEITAEIAAIGVENSLLGAYLYLRLIDLAHSSESTHCRECFQAAKSLLSSKQLERISEALPKDLPKVPPKDLPKVPPKDFPKVPPKDLPKAPPKDLPKALPKALPKDLPKALPEPLPKALPEPLPKETTSPPVNPAVDQFLRIYAQIRGDVQKGTHVNADQIASDLSHVASNEGDKEAIWKTAISLMGTEEVGREAGLTWKLVLFGMHKLMLYRGKQWFELNNALNEKFGDNRKRVWKRVEPQEETNTASQPKEETKAQPQPQTAPSLPKPPKNRRNIPKVPTVSAETTASGASSQPSKASSQPTPAPKDDFDAVGNDWENSDQRPTSKPEKTGKSKKPAA